MRQIALDTETTGLSTKNGDRIIEIGCVEILDRQITGREFHSYCNPKLTIDPKIVELTGITEQFLAPYPSFADLAADFLDFITGAELIIHNAIFDLEFINYELSLLNNGIVDLESICKVTDTLGLARALYPGQRNNLDALIKRYQLIVDRTLHGALIDSRILAQVFLKMTAGQISLDFTTKDQLLDPIIAGKNILKQVNKGECTSIAEVNKQMNNLKIIYANAEELKLHLEYFK